MDSADDAQKVLDAYVEAGSNSDIIPEIGGNEGPTYYENSEGEIVLIPPNSTNYRGRELYDKARRGDTQAILDYMSGNHMVEGEKTRESLIFSGSSDGDDRAQTSKSGSKGDIKTGEGIDMKDTKTWPKPPKEGAFTEGGPTRTKPRKRGEKSLYDSDGGQWRPSNVDKHHPEGHWDYKPPGNNTKWDNIHVD